MDPPIKLFGQTIAFTSSASSQDDAVDAAGTTSTGAWEEFASSPGSPQGMVENGSLGSSRTERVISECPSSCFGDLSSPGSNCAEEEKPSSSPCEFHMLVASQAGGSRVAEYSEDLDMEDGGSENLEGAVSQEVCGDDTGGKGMKMPRRPDKAVACPRCHSLETKFCYYNNYNVNQPRHFCKHCQRYWTAGGTLRNVPVGAGRRKNKHGGGVSPRHNPEVGLVRSDAPDVAAPLLLGKGSLDSGLTLPYTIRMPPLEAAYMLTSEAATSSDAGMLTGKLPHLATPGFGDVSISPKDVDGSCCCHKKDESDSSSLNGPCSSTLIREIKGETGASPEQERGGLTTGWNGGGTGGIGGSPAAPAPYGLFNGGWPYGYNIGWNGGAAFCSGPVTRGLNTLPPPQPTSVAAWSGSAAGSLWTSIPWSMPGLAWSPSGWGTHWSMAPWAMGAAGGTVVRSPSTPTHGASGLPITMPSTGSSTSSLGKQGRPIEGGQVEGALWAPKSLRMADPEESMRSSVWRILGSGSHPDLTPPSTFKAFQPKIESKKVPQEDQQAVQATLNANPAAMSRSRYFHESN